MSSSEINNASMLRKGTVLRGIYRIDSYLSSGGFGNTYVATNIEFDEQVAIKEFFMKGVTQRDGNQTTVNVSNSENKNSFLEQREKFKKEARRIRQLKNKHIVTVHDLFDENGTSYYVMDYVDGENLSDRLKRTGRAMTESEVRLILPQILDALKAVHEAGIWHLDLKPANIMLGKGGLVKLIDFGASKQLNAQKGGATTGTSVSYTNGYAPREQMEQNFEKFGPWTDIYALGATLYTLLSNKLPPLPTDIDDDISEDKHVALPLPDGISESMKSFVLKMLHTNRNLRPQCVDVLISFFEKSSEKKVANPSPEILVNKKIDRSVNRNDEETIIHPSTPRKPLEKPNDKDNPHSEKNPSVTYVSSISGKDNGKGKSVITFFIGAIAIIFLMGFIFAISNNESPNIHAVHQMEYKSSLGDYNYSGPVDGNNIPHGEGEAYFNDGRYYSGSFVHGKMEGKATFKYGNGDVFDGYFLDNKFSQGSYYIKSDGSHFNGTFKDGQPYQGSWYDKNGNKIEDVK